MESLQALGFDFRALALNIFGFLILLFVFRKFLYRPIGEFMGQRTKEIEGQISEAKSLNEEARQRHEKLQVELAAERDAARTDIGRITQEAKAAIEELHKEGRRERQEMVEQGRLEIERSKEAALAELRQTVADLAVETASKVIRQSLDEERQAGLVDQFLRDIEKSKN